MRLCTFRDAGSAKLGVVQDDGVVDLAEAAPELPREMIGAPRRRVGRARARGRRRVERAPPARRSPR